MDKNIDKGAEAYPKPTETDTQLSNQQEYITQQPNRIEKEISDVPEDASGKRGGDNTGGTIGNP